MASSVGSGEGGSWRSEWDLVEGAPESAGGQGTVRQVRRRVDGVVGALKELHPAHRDDTERRGRMAREVRALGQVQGMGVPAVLDDNMQLADDTSAPLYFVSEWVEGKNLQNQTGGRAMPIEDALKITRELAEVVARCHSVGVCHRDVKPDNIVVDSKDSALTLVDFQVLAPFSAKETPKMMEFVGSHVGGKLFDWTVGQGVLFFAGSEEERRARRVFEEAATGALNEVCDDAPADRASAEALGAHLASALTAQPGVAAALLRAANTKGSADVPVISERLRRSEEFDPEFVPFEMDAFLAALVLRLGEVVDREVRGMGFAEAMISDKLDELFARTEGSAPADGRRDLLPPPPGLVLGRADELSAAKRALELSSTGPEVQKTVVAVHGGPGVGKSTFVSELCNDGEVLERFSGGVFFIPVGRSSDARRLADEVCTALEIPVPPGATPDALRGRIANALSQRRVLLAFDDVWDERHVAPLLLAGRGSAALIATRRLDVASRLATAPEGALRIGLLSDADSLRLLRSRAPAVATEHEWACRDLAKALDGLPLALRVAADLLQVEAGSGFDVSDLLEELAEAARVLGEEAPADVGGGDELGAEGATRTVRAVLRKSLERADGDLVRRFARLGVLPPKPLSFGPWAVTDMWRDSAEDLPEDGQSEEEKARDRDALRELVRRGLVESVDLSVDPLAVKLDLTPKRPERFWMHSLVAAFALETLERTEGEGGVREAQQRRLEHYRRIAGAADGALSQGGDAQFFGVFLITLDLPNIRAAHGWAREQAPSDRRSLGYLSRLLSQGSRPLAERLGPGEWLEWMRLAENAARRLGDESEAGYHRSNVGAALVRNGMMGEALTVCLDNLEVALRDGDAASEAAMLANLAIIQRRRGEHEAALDYARRAAEAAQRADSPSTLAGAIGQQATTLMSLGRMEEAEARYEAMRVFARDNGELSQHAKALLELAKIKRGRSEDRDEARRLFEEAAEVFRDLREYDQYRLAVAGLGVLENEARRFDEAEGAFRRTLGSAVQDGDKGDEARAKMHLGIVHRYRGEPGGTETAETEFREALPLAASSEDGDKLGDVLMNLAWLLYEDRRDFEGARRFAEDAAEAYANVQSEKESWAKDLISEINDTGAA